MTLLWHKSCFVFGITKVGPIIHRDWTESQRTFTKTKDNKLLFAERIDRKHTQRHTVLRTAGITCWTLGKLLLLILHSVHLWTCIFTWCIIEGDVGIKLTTMKSTTLHIVYMRDQLITLKLAATTTTIIRHCEETERMQRRGNNATGGESYFYTIRTDRDLNCISLLLLLAMCHRWRKYELLRNLCFTEPNHRKTPLTRSVPSASFRQFRWKEKRAAGSPLLYTADGATPVTLHQRSMSALHNSAFSMISRCFSHVRPDNYLSVEQLANFSACVDKVFLSGCCCCKADRPLCSVSSCVFVTCWEWKHALHENN